jgi:hypothetical protein
MFGLKRARNVAPGILNISSRRTNTQHHLRRALATSSVRPQLSRNAWLWTAAAATVAAGMLAPTLHMDNDMNSNMIPEVDESSETVGQKRFSILSSSN